MSASQNSWLTDLDTQFFEVKELIAEAEVQIQEAVFFSGVGAVTHWAKIDQLTPKNWLFLGMKKNPQFFLGGISSWWNFTTQLYLVKFDGYSS